MAPAAAAAAAVLLLASSARADVDPEKRAAAQALFDDGRELSTQPKFAEACPKLLESYNLDPAIGTKFYLAQCYEAIGKLASAWTFYLEVAEEAHKQGSTDREKFATDRATALKPRLARLTVAVAPAARVPGLAVKRDGAVVGTGAWDTPIPVDLGDHVISATAPGMKRWEIHGEAKQEGALVRVEVPALEAEPAPLVPVKQAPEAPEAPPTPRWATGQGIAGIVIGGVGIVGLGGGIGAGLLAMSRKSASNAGGDCVASTDVCTPAGTKLRASAINAATASTILFAAGGAAFVAGGVMLLTAPSGRKAPAPATGLVLGPGSVSLVGRL